MFVNYKYNAELITIVGFVSITAQTNNEGFVVAHFNNEGDKWAQRFPSVSQFKTYVSKFQIKDQIKITESYC